MITVTFTGGLGNQMFQYAFGKACSVRLKEPLFLDLTWYYKSNKRKFLLDEFDVSYEKSSQSKMAVGISNLMHRPTILKDAGFFDENNLKASGNLLLDGSWESYRYFEPIKDMILKGFTLKDPSARFLELSKSIPRDSIAVHVRRGDYLIPHGKHLNGFDYYNKGVECILKAKHVEKPLITVFSDDPEWCAQELKVLGGQPTEVFREKLDSDAEELMLMSLYGNNVISNSTFSWWAAYLNKDPDKIVAMPKDWFTDKERNERYRMGMEVPGWIVIG